MKDFVSRAVPYLKASLPPSNQAAITLDEHQPPILNRLTDGVMIAYVVDEANGFVHIQKRHLEQAGITVQQLHQQAIQNLNRLYEANAQVQQHGPVYGVFMDGNLEASLFLLEHFWQRDYAHLVKEGFYVCIAARDVLAFCDMDSQEGLSTLTEMARRVSDGGDHLLTQTIFRIRKKAA